MNLLENEESYTAFVGGPIWKSIYEENCVLDKAFSDIKQRVNREKYLMLDSTESCTEATLLYHLMSGFHASVNTHISEGFESKESPGELVNNRTYFLNSVGDHPDRVKNLHFLYAAVVKAVSLMEKSLINNDFETGLKNSDDVRAKQLVMMLLQRLH